MQDFKRLSWVDGLRGIAIIAMVVYHFLFDAYFLRLFPVPIHDLPLVIFQRSIGTLFLLLVGVSMALSEQRNSEGYLRYVKRFLFLGIIALGITLATFIYPSNGFIQFGIIHFIAVATLITPLFLRLKHLLLPIGLIIIGVGWWISSITIQNPYFFWVGLRTADYFALDHYPLLPWIGVVFIGVYIGQKLVEKKLTNPHDFFSHPVLVWLGKKSLMIYLIHQPLLVALILLIKQMLA